jgi:hypothetical protein
MLMNIVFVRSLSSVFSDPPLFEISRITGKTILSGTLPASHDIGVAQLPAGVCLLGIFLQERTIIRKVVVR